MKKVIIVIFILLIIGLGVFGYYYFKNNKAPSEVISELGQKITKKEEPKKEEFKIFNGNDRPIAVMIDNNKRALPHAGLNKAYMIYEIIVEGGESRLMALFKESDIPKIGPVRSSRHYFLDFALEHDAIYAHFGWSPKAEAEIKSLKVNNINGLLYDGTVFKRTKDKVKPHNAVSSIKDLREAAERLGYRLKSDKESVLKYSNKEIELNGENSEVATKIHIPISYLNSVDWKYNSETKKYLRKTRGIEEKDWDTKENFEAKNIIIEFIKNTKLNDKSGKDRQDMDTTGVKEGYYITNGRAIKIKCTKNTRTSVTKYEDLEGNEIKFNDGNTFVQIVPSDAKIKIGSMDE